LNNEGFPEEQESKEQVLEKRNNTYNGRVAKSIMVGIDDNDRSGKTFV